MLIDIGLLLEGDVIVVDGSPVGDKKAMGIIDTAGDALEHTRRNEVTEIDDGTALDALTSVVGEGHVILREPDAVAIDIGEAAGTDEVREPALLLQGVVLSHTRLINKIEGLLHRPVDELLIRGKGEEEIVEHLDMTLCLHVKGLVHVCLGDKDGDMARAVKDIDPATGIGEDAPLREQTSETDDHVTDKEHQTDDRHELDLVF